MKLLLSVSVFAFSLALTLFGGTAPASAERVLAAEHFIKLGDAALKAGNPTEAYQYFSKALLAEPSNETAYDRIDKMGYDGGLFPSNHTSIEKARRLEGQLAEYKNQLAATAKNLAIAEESVLAVRKERDRWLAAQKGKELEALMLEEKLLQVQDVALYSTRQQADRFGQMADVYETQLSELRKTNDELTTKMQSADEGAFEIAFYQQKYRDALAHSVSVEKELRVLNHRYQELASRDHGVYRHQDKLIRVLEEYSRLAQQEASDAKDRLVSKQMDLVKREQQLVDTLGELEEAYKGKTD